MNTLLDREISRVVAIVCCLAAAAAIPTLSLVRGCQRQRFSAPSPLVGTIAYQVGDLPTDLPIPYVHVKLERFDPSLEEFSPLQTVETIVGDDGKTLTIAGDAPNALLPPGAYKAVVTSIDTQGRPTNCVPAEYGDAATTPLVISTAFEAFTLLVPKP